MNNMSRNCAVFFGFGICLVFFVSCAIDGPMGRPSYTVVFDANGGVGAMEPSSRKHGIAIDLIPNAFTKEGYAFAGWAKLSNNGGIAEFIDRQNVTNLATTDRAIVRLYAVWRPHTFTVVYNANGGSGNMEPSVFRINADEWNLSPNVFANPPETFIGWSRELDGHVEFRDRGSVKNLTAVYGDEVTLFARWGNGTFTVAFDLNGGIGTVPLSPQVLAGSHVTLFAGSGLPESGFTFTGWNTMPNGMGTHFAVDTIYTPYRNITLYAQWMVDFTVIFDVNGGTGNVPVPKTVSKGFSLILPEGSELSRGWYTFGGWNTNACGTGMNFDAGSDCTPTGNITLYARWLLPTLATRLAWLQANAQTGGAYLLEVTENENIAPHVLYFGGRNNIAIFLRGIGLTRILSLSANGNLFTIGHGVTLVLEDNITLMGRKIGGNGNVNNNAPLVEVNVGGVLVMNDGANITGNTNISPAGQGGGVRVNIGGTFNMYGGIIYGNSVQMGGSGNISSSDRSGTPIPPPFAGIFGGGGVHNSGTFTMRGGRISSNSAGSGGGGVGNIGEFRISNGIIFGSSESREALRNTATSGASVFVATGAKAQRGLFDVAGVFTQLGTVFSSDDTLRVVNGHPEHHTSAPW